MKKPPKKAPQKPGPVSVIKRPQLISHQDEALARIGVTRAQLAIAPPITNMLEQADGGLAQVLSAMRFCPDATIAAFLEKYDAIAPEDRECLEIEAIALAASIHTPQLLNSILSALQAQAMNAVKIIAMTSHPKITQARVDFGQLPLGERDRTALDTAMGFLPSPKGPTFIGKAIFGSGKNVIDAQRSDDDGGDNDDDDSSMGDIDLDKLFPPASAMQQKLSAIRNRTRALPPPGKGD